jgi:hypothetical protein
VCDIILKSHSHYDTESGRSNRLAIAGIMSATAMCNRVRAALPTEPGTEHFLEQGVVVI